MTTQPVNFFADPFGAIGRYAQPFVDLALAKALVDANDGEFGLQIDPMNNQLGIKSTTTMGSAGLTSIWRSTDMFWIAGAAVLLLGAVLIVKK
jgi:hypothetical protein